MSMGKALDSSGSGLGNPLHWCKNPESRLLKEISEERRSLTEIASVKPDRGSTRTRIRCHEHE
jgi:hypothetical protein